MFGLTCAKKYGGVYVPPHQAVIHQYAREMLSGGGQMILGSDSHTRYGALGTMAHGEGRSGAGKTAAEPDLRYPYAGCGGRLSHRRTHERRGSAGRGAGDHQSSVCQRLCEQQSDGVHRRRRVEAECGFPYRHRCDDYGDHLPVLHLENR